MDRAIVAAIIILAALFVARKFYRAVKSRKCACCADSGRPSGTCSCGCGGTAAQAAQPAESCGCGCGAAEKGAGAEPAEEPAAAPCPYCSGKK